MEFDKLFVESIKEYKKNLGLISKIFIYFALIPGLIFYTITYFLENKIKNFTQGYQGMSTFSSFFSIIKQNNLWSYIILILLIIILLALLNMFVNLCMIVISLSKNKPSGVIKTSKKHFWKYVLFVIVLNFFIYGMVFLSAIPVALFGLLSYYVSKWFLIIVIPLAILPVITLIYFFIRWILSPYILINEEKKILESLKQSSRLLKQNPGKIYGYSILYGLIFIVASVLFSLIYNYFSIIIYYFNRGYIFNGILKEIYNIIKSFILMPITVLFFKNLYLGLKPKTKK